MNHPNDVLSTGSIQKILLSNTKWDEPPKTPSPGVWVGLGVNWSDGRDSVNDGKGRQSTHNHRTIIAQPNTNKMSINNYHCTNTNKLPTHIPQPSHNHRTTKNQQIVNPQLSLHNQIQTQPHKQIQTKLTIFVLWSPSLLNDETNWKENTV